LKAKFSIQTWGRLVLTAGLIE